MKALVKKQPGEGLWLEDMPQPSVAANDVLIKVNRTGICGTDLHIYKWDDWADKTIPVPLVVGHEFVGEIVEVGSGVRDFSVGELVSGEGHVVCGHCRNCMAGRRHLCNDTAGIGVTRPGAFAEYISLPQTNVWVHKPGIDLDVASIFDPFGNATHTTGMRAGHRCSSSLLVAVVVMAASAWETPLRRSGHKTSSAHKHAPHRQAGSRAGHVGGARRLRKARRAG